jgi:hypothetical protein
MNGIGLVISITSLKFLPDLFMVIPFRSVTVSEAGNKSSIKFCDSLSLIEIWTVFKLPNMNRTKFSEESNFNFMKIFLVKVSGFKACRWPPTITLYYSVNKTEIQADPSTIIKSWYKELQHFCSSNFSKN